MKNLIYIILFSVFIISCSTSSNKNISSDDKNSLSINIATNINTLYPPAINDVYSMQIASQIFDGLVKYNTTDLTIEPSIADSWEINEDFTEFTFYLRKDVFFHDNKCFKDGKGRRLIAKDVEFSLKNLCSQKYTNNNFKTVLNNVLGANNYYKNSLKTDKDSIAGIIIINDFEIKLKLEKSTPFFLNLLAMPIASIYPKEAFDMYKEKNYVGTGAFRINEYLTTNKIVLLKNKDYFKKDAENLKLPYLDTIFVGIENSIQQEMSQFENGKIDIVMNVPSAYISEFMDKNIKCFESNPPKFIVSSYTEEENNEMYNLLKSNIHNFSTNNMNYINLSIVYLEDAVAITDTIAQQ